MFISINKKILYIIFAFLLLIIAVFFTIYMNFYSNNLQNQQNTLYLRNKYVIELLYDNISLRKEIADLWEKYPDAAKISKIENVSQGLNLSQKELTHEQKLNAELQRNYDSNRAAINVGAQIIGFSLLVTVLFILLLFFLLNHWVIKPIEKMAKVSKIVSQGIFSSRIPLRETSGTRDEFDMLFGTFNNMLDNMEYNIRAVKNRELFLQKLIDAIPDGIRVIDKNYNVVMANRSFHQMLKLKKSSVGNKCYQAYGYNCEGCQRQKYTCPLQFLLKEKNSETMHTIHEIGKMPFYVNASRLPISAEKDDVYIIEALHDLSGDIRFSHQQKVASLAFLSTSIAHEMKNNLGAIRMLFEGILSSYYQNIPDTDDQKKYLLMAYHKLVETVKTPERLLSLAQYSENEQSRIDINNAIKDMLLMIDYDAKRNGIVIKTDLEKKLFFCGNEADFKMIILNLTQNAIKAMPDGGMLQIKTHKDKKNIYVHIADNGIGIDENQIKHIFEPFYSANNNIKSSGLGLAIVSSLVEKLRGKISVKSSINKGSTFTIRIPLPKDKEKAAQ